MYNYNGRQATTQASYPNEDVPPYQYPMGTDDQVIVLDVAKDDNRQVDNKQAKKLSKKKANKNANNKTAVDQEAPETNITEKILRKGFIKKVLSILIIQLIITCITVGLTFSESIGFREFLRKHQYGLYIALAVSIVCVILLGCFRKIARKVPINYLLLLLYTLSTAWLLASIAAVSKSTIVIFSAGFTLFAVFVIATVSCWTKRDLTKKAYFGMSLVSVLFMLLIFGLIFRSHIVNVIISCVVGLLFSFLFAVDVQRLSGQYQQKYSLDDYVIAALDLYIDIVQIFLSVLSVGNATSR